MCPFASVLAFCTMFIIHYYGPMRRTTCLEYVAVSVAAAAALAIAVCVSIFFFLLFNCFNDIGSLTARWSDDYVWWTLLLLGTWFKWPALMRNNVSVMERRLAARVEEENNNAVLLTQKMISSSFKSESVDTYGRSSDRIEIRYKTMVFRWRWANKTDRNVSTIDAAQKCR